LITLADWFCFLWFRRDFGDSCWW